MISKVRVNKDNYIGNNVMVSVDRDEVPYPRVSITVNNHTLILNQRDWDELLRIVKMMYD